jgi:pyruvate dehydrogenase E2 component (dihydrolipoamide acetyltransferase)
VSEPSSLKGEVHTIEPDRAGRSIARRSAEVRATIPQLELSADVDAGAITASARDAGCSVTAALVRACAGALTESPWANAAYRDGRYELYSRVNIGLTLHTEDGFATPALLDADTKSISALDAEIERLRGRAGSGELTPPELAGTTFTFTDFSPFAAVQRYVPLITPPQAAAVTAGAVRSAPVVRDGELVAGELLTLSLTCDHRILYGARAAGFLERLVDHVENPRP